MRILYVEDNMANVSLVRRIAKNDEVINYIDGSEALANFEDDNPDLVLLDIQLAGPLNGLEVVKRLRERGVTLPVIAVTAYAMVGDRERCLAAGCDDYISKPLPIPQLVTLFEDRRKQIATVNQPEADEETVRSSKKQDASSSTKASVPLGTTTERIPIPSTQTSSALASAEASSTADKTVKPDEVDASHEGGSSAETTVPTDSETLPSTSEADKTVKPDEVDASHKGGSSAETTMPIDPETLPSTSEADKTVNLDEADSSREEVSSQK